MAATVQVGTVTGAWIHTSSIVSITLSIEAGEEIAAAQFDLTYDASAVSVKSVSAGPAALAAGKEVSFSDVDEDTVRIVVSGFNLNTLGEGVIANVALTVLRTASAGVYPVTPVNEMLSNPLGEPVAVDAQGGWVEVYIPPLPAPGPAALGAVLVLAGITVLLRRRLTARRVGAKSLLGASLVFLCLTGPATAVQIDMSTPQVRNGALVVSVNMTPASGELPAGVQFDVHFDPSQGDLVDVSVGDAAARAGKTIFVEEVTPGQARVVIAGFNLDGIGAGSIAEVVLATSGTANASNGPRLENLIVSDPHGQPLNAQLAGDDDTTEQPSADSASASKAAPETANSGKTQVAGIGLEQDGSAASSPRNVAGEGRPAGRWIPEAEAEERRSLPVAIELARSNPPRGTGASGTRGEAAPARSGDSGTQRSSLGAARGGSLPAAPDSGTPGVGQPFQMAMGAGPAAALAPLDKAVPPVPGARPATPSSDSTGRLLVLGLAGAVSLLLVAFAHVGQRRTRYRGARRR
ncbi:MAG: cohesin domain-containing protein [FCB group bacterium]|jgi:hypothetical protein|nr:cohesin domain-containing protein [FCB group bacterium]